ncbi:7b0b8c07-7cfb-4801-bf27-3e7919fb9641 [Thermothielavioides terrestris]|jgi:hypothetical protein|uniref:Uncharacterized protein n=2 Tax=Thermothielavioides terrestris TaxID=2587410 RepID=G2QTZ3_THETT|nr:uncharacterized protein THITE_2126127 [Thermothielavioides terrestris NRRL 8126]AEO63652.1 hypothetical protein THITE_2126127 [Thermothielavioides terrestris NRRL 8126]SPQ20851.1 7b0b8c07-7cfb-4801-bf27-3e7919fb9641 [Thermothielavioides terrestris]
MCIYRIPQHPWCSCRDPSETDANGNITCPHHVWVLPESPHIARLPPAAQDHLNFCVAAIPRPAPGWAHCATYRARHTSRTSGAVIAGHELACPETMARAEAAAAAAPGAGAGWCGYKEVYQWDGLCGHCDRPGRGVPLAVVPLRHRFEVDAESHIYHRVAARRAAAAAAEGPFDGAGEREQEEMEEEEEEPWQDLVACGLEMPDGSAIPEVLEKRIILDRKAVGRGEGLYVDVVEGMQMGKWEVDLDRSAIYLLPGLGYDPEKVPGEPRKEDNGEASTLSCVVEAVKGMVGKMF